MGLTDPTDPGGEGDAVEIGGPLPAAPIEMARSGCAHVEPCAAQEAASEQGPGTGQGGVALPAGVGRVGQAHGSADTTTGSGSQPRPTSQPTSSCT